MLRRESCCRVLAEAREGESAVFCMDMEVDYRFARGRMERAEAAVAGKCWEDRRCGEAQTDCDRSNKHGYVQKVARLTRKKEGIGLMRSNGAALF